LKQGDKALVGNKGYRKYLKRETDQAAFTIDEDKLQEEARYDGLWVLRTNTDYPAEEVAFQYKQLCRAREAWERGMSRTETFRRDPAGNQSCLAKTGHQPEASLAGYWGDPDREA